MQWIHARAILWLFQTHPQNLQRWAKCSQIQQRDVCCWVLCLFNPMCPRGGGWGAHVSRMCVYLCKYMNQRVEKLDFLLLWIWKRGVRFFSIKLSRFAKLKACQKHQTGSDTSLTKLPTKNIKSQTLFSKVLGIQFSWILLKMEKK